LRAAVGGDEGVACSGLDHANPTTTIWTASTTLLSRCAMSSTGYAGRAADRALQLALVLRVERGAGFARNTSGEVQTCPPPTAADSIVADWAG
jgi:hypothetical protein